MSAATCPNCGAPLSAGAQFCSYCGQSLPTPAAPAPASPGPVGPAPWTSSVSPPMGGSLGYPRSAGGPPPRRGSRLLVLVIVVVVVVAIVGFVFLESSAAQVNITEINLWSPDNVCGIAANSPYDYNGFSDSPGNSDPIGLQIENFNLTTCTIHSVATNTSGFSLSGVGVPLSVAGSGFNYLNLTINLPGSGFSGALNLVVT